MQTEQATCKSSNHRAALEGKIPGHSGLSLEIHPHLCAPILRGPQQEQPHVRPRGGEWGPPTAGTRAPTSQFLQTPHFLL